MILNRYLFDHRPNSVPKRAQACPKWGCLLACPRAPLYRGHGHGARVQGTEACPNGVGTLYLGSPQK
jgi:hypothetical protein